MVNEVIEKLPQRRQAEIKKRVDEAVGHAPGGDADHLAPPETDREHASRARSRGYSSKRGKSGKSSERSRRPSDLNADEEGEQKRGVSPLKTVGSEQQLLFHTKKAQANVSGRFQASLSDVVLTIKNVGQDRDRLRV